VASNFTTIAAAVRTVIAGLSGAPDTVLVKDDDSIHPGEAPAVIVTMGDEEESIAVSGAGTDTDQGDRLMAYQIGVTIYKGNLGTNEALGTNQDFVLACQQALNRKSLAGAPSVYGTKLVRRDAWERQALKDGVEVSRFGLIFYSAETRLGNP